MHDLNNSKIIDYFSLIVYKKNMRAWVCFLAKPATVTTVLSLDSFNAASGSVGAQQNFESNLIEFAKQSLKQKAFREYQVLDSL